MLKKLTKKSIEGKRVLNDRMAFQSECYLFCLMDCGDNLQRYTIDYQMKVLM